MHVLKVSIRPNDSAVVKKIVNNVKNNETRLFSIPKNPPQKLFLFGPPNNGKAILKLDVKPAKPTFLSMNISKYIDESISKRLSCANHEEGHTKFSSDKVIAMLDEIRGIKLDIKPFNKNELMERFAKKIEIKNPNQLD